MKFFLLLFAVFLCLAMKLPAQDRASSAAFHGFALDFRHSENSSLQNAYKDYIRNGAFKLKRIGILYPPYETETPNYTRFCLHADSIIRYHGGVPQLVLADPQPTTIDKNLTIEPLSLPVQNDSDGWWVVLNLRRLFYMQQNAVADSMSVVSIRLPLVIRYESTDIKGNHLLYRDTVYITFDSTAVVGTPVIEHPWLGKMDGPLSAANTSSFVIRKGMLPAFNDSPRPDIMLSAHFRLPEMAVGMQIERVLVEVLYHGNVDIGLDWLRIEDKAARMRFRPMENTDNVPAYFR